MEPVTQIGPSRPKSFAFTGLALIFSAGGLLGQQGLPLDGDIGLVTNKTLDPKNPNYRLEHQGKVFGFLKSDDSNPIDPNLAPGAPAGPCWAAPTTSPGRTKTKMTDGLRTGKMTSLNIMDSGTR